MSRQPDDRLATRLAELSRLKLMDTVYGRAGEKLSATLGLGSVPLLHLRFQRDGIEVDVFRNELKFLVEKPAFVSIRQPAFRIPAKLAGDPGHLFHIAEGDENAAGNMLYQRFRHLLEPGPLWLARGNFELQERYHRALGLFLESANMPTYTSIEDERDYLGSGSQLVGPDFPKACAIGTAWFHPVQWTPVIHDHVLEHRPLFRSFLWGAVKRHDTGHEAFAEADWLHEFLAAACSDLGIERTQADEAMRELIRSR